MKNYKKLTISGIIIMVALVSSACAAGRKGLDATSWKLDTYRNQQDKQVNVLPESVITLDFQTGNYSGLTGCNSYSGSYTTDVGDLTFGPPASTRKICTEPLGIMEQEKAYLDALEKVVSYKVSGAALEMFDSRRDSILKYTQAGQ